MGYTSDIMHTIVEKELKRHYPVSDGWVLQPGSKKVGRSEIFTITKKRGGKNEVAFVGISFEKTTSSELINELRSAVQSPAALRAMSQSALIVPQGTDEKNVPASVKVTYMRAFRYTDDELIWLKHPLHKAEVSSSS
jgi:hypothetical protein